MITGHYPMNCAFGGDRTGYLKNICKSIKSQIADLIVLQNSMGTVTSRLLWGITCDVVEFMAAIGENGVVLECDEVPYIITVLYSEYRSSLVHLDPYGSKIPHSVRSEVKSWGELLKNLFCPLKEVAVKIGCTRERIDRAMLGNLLRILQVVSAVSNIYATGGSSPSTQQSEPMTFSSEYERTLNSNYDFEENDEIPLNGIISYAIPLTPTAPDADDRLSKMPSGKPLQNQKIKNGPPADDTGSIYGDSVPADSRLYNVELFNNIYPNEAGMAREKDNVSAEKKTLNGGMYNSDTCDASGSDLKIDGYKFHDNNKKYRKNGIMSYAQSKIPNITNIAEKIRRRIKMKGNTVNVGREGKCTVESQISLHTAEAPEDTPDIIKLFVQDSSQEQVKTSSKGLMLLRRSSMVVEKFLSNTVSRFADIGKSQRGCVGMPHCGMLSKCYNTCWCKYRDSLNNLDISSLMTPNSKEEKPFSNMYTHIIAKKKDLESTIKWASAITDTYRNRTQAAKCMKDFDIPSSKLSTTILPICGEFRRSNRPSSSSAYRANPNSDLKYKFSLLKRTPPPTLCVSKAIENATGVPESFLSNFARIVQTRWRMVLAEEKVETAKKLFCVVKDHADGECSYLDNLIAFHKEYVQPAFVFSTEITNPLYIKAQYVVAHLYEIMVKSASFLEILAQSILHWNVKTDVSCTLLDFSYTLFPYMHFIPNSNSAVEIWEEYLSQKHSQDINLQRKKLSYAKMRILNVFSSPQCQLSNYISVLKKINHIAPNPIALEALERFEKASDLISSLGKRTTIVSQIRHIIPQNVEVGLLQYHDILIHICKATIIDVDNLQCEDINPTVKIDNVMLKDCLLLAFKNSILLFEANFNDEHSYHDLLSMEYFNTSNISFNRYIDLGKITEITYLSNADNSGYIFSISYLTKLNLKTCVTITLGKDPSCGSFYTTLLQLFPSIITKKNPLVVNCLSESWSSI